MEQYSKIPSDPFGLNYYEGTLGERFLSFSYDADATFSIMKIGITPPDENYRIQRTINNVLILEFVEEGEGWVEVNGSSYKVRAGDVYLLSTGVGHAYGASKNNPYKKIWINFYSSLFTTLIREHKLDSRVVFHTNDKMKDAFYSLLSTAEKLKNDQKVHLEISKIVYSILVDLINIEDEITPSSDIALTAKYVLDARHHYNTKIKDLAKYLCVSEVYLIKKFKEAYGVTPHQYVLNKRIGIAKNLLTNSTLSVAEIALQLSFNDEHYFSNIFKQKTGVTPSEFRSKNSTPPRL